MLSRHTDTGFDSNSVWYVLIDNTTSSASNLKTLITGTKTDNLVHRIKPHFGSETAVHDLSDYCWWSPTPWLPLHRHLGFFSQITWGFEVWTRPEYDIELTYWSKWLLQVGKIQSFQPNMVWKAVDQINFKHIQLMYDSNSCIYTCIYRKFYKDFCEALNHSHRMADPC